MAGFGKWRCKPELGLANIEWIVVDVLYGGYYRTPLPYPPLSFWILDPDFQETTRIMLADISSARGHLFAVLSSTELSTVDPQLSTLVTPEPNQPSLNQWYHP